MSRPIDTLPLVMKVLDELSEKYFIHHNPLLKKNDSLEKGWSPTKNRKTTVNFVFQVEKPTRAEIQRDVKNILDELSE